MRLELMRPHQIRDAIDRHLPVVLPLGVIEYHGEHLGVGMDLLAVTRVLDRLEREAEIVILPPFAYGAASYAVEGPEATGTLHVDAQRILPLAEAMFAGLLRIGFRNIHGVIHHQTEKFEQGMPTDLAFRLAGRQAVFQFLEQERGSGWWGRAEMQDYYAEQAAGADPFDWIKVHPLMSQTVTAAYPFDHAGIGETSLMLALAPDAVEMARTSQNHGWYTATAVEATAALGERGVAKILAHLRAVLGLDPAAAGK